jgi:hypothetical protein
VIDELARIWTEAVVAKFKVSPGMFLQELRENTKNVSQDSQSPDQDLNTGPPEYEARSANHSITAFGDRQTYETSHIFICKIHNVERIINDVPTYSKHLSQCTLRGLAIS